MSEGHFCKSCDDARKGAPVPYDKLDPEMVDIVRALNTVDGIRTLDSCFGHTGSGDPNKGHQTHAYVGMTLSENSGDKFARFWGSFFSHFSGKFEASDGFIQFTVVEYLFEPYALMRLHVECQHDPSIDPRGGREKKEAFKILEAYIRSYNAEHRDN